MRFLLALLLVLPALAQVVPGQFIVELSGRSAMESALQAGGRRELVRFRDQVRRSQGTVRRLVEMRGRTIATVETVANALIVEAPGESRDSLAAIPGVARVFPVRQFRLEMDRVLDLHGVRAGWNRIGGEASAGAGVRIGVLDSGIEANHPGFQAPGLAPPDGFPKVDRPEWKERFTNNKIIVARTYDRLISGAGQENLEDRAGHGTAVAMAAAGMPVDAPLARISGVAPGAFLGSYKVFGGARGDISSSAAILKAIDDAVADGMDVLNMSFGSIPASPPEQDFEVRVIERISAGGVLVVKSAGNLGPEPGWISSPATAPSSIAVGATVSDRFFGSAVDLETGTLYLALSGDNSFGGPTVRGRILDVTAFDPTGLACDPLPAGSLEGVIPLILRGTCFFEVKVNNAQRAGAAGVVIYTDAERPQPNPMALGAAQLPALMISHADGLALKAKLAGEEPVKGALFFDSRAVPQDPGRVASFSSRGPNPNYAIKPDLTAVGENVYTAAQREFPSGVIYSKAGYQVVDGTSFSAPVVAGAAAVLKAGRPGLTVAQLQSLLVNSASPVVSGEGTVAPVQHTGAGALNLDAALTGPAAAYPVSVSFGAGTGSISQIREVTLTNVSASNDNFSLEVAPARPGAAPVVLPAQITLDPGQSATFRLLWEATGLESGEYQGHVLFRGSTGTIVGRLPYWYGISTDRLRYLSLFAKSDAVAPGSIASIFVRTTDDIGLPFTGAQPTAVSLEGGGTVLRVAKSELGVEGLYEVTVRATDRRGQSMLFEIRAGEYRREVRLTTSGGP
jgi:subtilisin family serine protease